MRYMIVSSVLAIAGCGVNEEIESKSPPPVSVTTTSAGTYVVMTRPANVPTTYVATPHGWVDPACVHVIGDGESVRASGPCASPRYDAEGVEVGVSSSIARQYAPASSGYIEYVDSVSTGAVGYMHADWTVPPAPAVTDATVYFFPGLENFANLDTPILQPVLGWNAYDGAAGMWTLQSWDCCSNGYNHSPAIPAGTTTVSGDLTGTNCNAQGVCANWQIVSRNANGRTTTLNTTASAKMDRVFGATLETYGVSQCAELPATGSTTSGILLKNTSGVKIPAIVWSDRVQPGVTPSCGYSATHTATTTSVNVNQCTPGDVRDCCPFADGCSCSGDQTCRANATWGACQGAGETGHACP